MADEIDQLRWERDFYSRLLNLDRADDIDPLLAGALDLALDVTGAAQGYISLGEDQAWTLARGFSDPEQATIRRAISGGIMAEAVATGAPVVTHSAFLDPRFAGMQSVRRNRLDAVMCVPIAGPVLGALYLQGRRTPGTFSPADLKNAEVFARHLAPLADRLVARARRATPDPAAELRARLGANHVVGRSDALAHVLHQCSLVAGLDIGVMFTGPTGSGKSMFAKLVVDNSRRRAGPLVEVNCASIPENLLEAELFGSRRGAFTGAVADRPGRFGQAAGGTLFLDEVGELPLSAQAKLLQVLQSGTYFAVGDDRARRADVRVISATNLDLDRAVEGGTFRADLLYRLAVFRIRVPGLDERREDVDAIAQQALASACERFGFARLRLAPSAAAALASHSWRGHVRELVHHVEAAAVRAAGEGLEAVEARHVFTERAGAEFEGAASFQDATRRYQRELVKDALEATGWNVAEAARRLDLARSHLYTLISGFGLERQ